MHEIVRLNVFKDRVVVIPRESEKPACEIPFTEELGWDLDVSELLTTEVLPEFAV
jgi:hypothetical protein